MRISGVKLFIIGTIRFTYIGSFTATNVKVILVDQQNEALNFKSNSFLIILTLGVLTAISSISIDLYLPAFGMMADYFKVPLGKMEFTVTLFIGGMAIGQLFTGPISDVWGRQLPLRIALVIYILSSIASMFTDSFHIFLTLRFIQGLAGSTTQVVSRALVSDLYSGKNAARTFTVLQILMGVCPILSPLIGGFISGISSWQYLFLIMAAISGVGMLACLIIFPWDIKIKKLKEYSLTTILKGYGRCIAHPGFVNFALVRAVSNSTAFLLITNSPQVFMQIYGMNKSQYGLIFSGLAAAVIVAGILNTQVLKHFSILLIIKAAVIFQITIGLALMVALKFTAPFPSLIILMFLFISMLGFILPNSTALYFRVFESDGGTSSAVLGSVSYLSAFLITTLLSLSNQHTISSMAGSMLCWFCLPLFDLQSWLDQAYTKII